MIDFATIKAHLVRTGRLKLLPRILRELREQSARDAKRQDRKETVQEKPELVSGWREIKGDVLTDHTGKRALLEIYQKSIS